MAAGSLRRRLEQIPISNDYGLERLHVSFHAQPVPLIQLTDTNKIINSSTATFMTRSLKKTTSPELQISPEQASEQQSSWQASARRAAKWLTPIVDFQEGRPTRNWLHGTNEPPPLNARNNFNATRPLNNSSKIGQKNISFFYFFLSFFSLSLSLSPSPRGKLRWEEGRGGEEERGLSSLPMERFALITVGPRSLRPLKARDGDWTRTTVGSVNVKQIQLP